MAKLAIVAAIAAAGFGAGWRVRAWKSASDDRARLEQQSEADRLGRARINAAGAAFETGRAAAATRERIVYRDVVKLVQAPWYAASAPACLDPDGLRILSADIDASTARRGIATALPSSAASGGRE